MLSAETRLMVADGVMFNEIDGEVVLLSQLTGVYFGLNDVGASIWSHLVRREPLGQIHTALVGEFEVAADQAWTDLVRLASEMLTEGLVREDGP